MNADFDKLREWDAEWADKHLKVCENVWTNGILPPKTIELICVGLSSACNNLDLAGTRRHIRAALEAGATRDEILLVLKMASLMAIHSCSLGASVLWDEAKAMGVAYTREKNAGLDTSGCDNLREMNQWNEAWDVLCELDPAWTEHVMDAGMQVFESDLMSPVTVRLISIALDSSLSHPNPSRIRRHIKTALDLGATIDEIMEVLKVCVAQGLETCCQAIPILAQELDRFE